MISTLFVYLVKGISILVPLGLEQATTELLGDWVSMSLFGFSLIL
jgi:hypothetical protein